MKKVNAGLIIAVITSVFLISFIVGRASVQEKSVEENKEITYGGFVPMTEVEEKSVETATKAEKVPNSIPKKNKTEEASVIPQRMLFPCGETVLKEYSQTAIYSATMGDWRAHTGIDYSAEIGTEVKSVWDGKVARVYVDKLWGNTVEICHTDKLVSIYKNLDENIPVKEGQAVSKGQAIGYVGQSADIEKLEDSHLHFEMMYDEVKINPESYVY